MKINRLLIAAAALVPLVNPGVVSADQTAFYGELFVGRAGEGVASPDSDTDSAGAFFNGRSRRVDQGEGDVVGGRLGWQYSPRWRFEIAYYGVDAALSWETHYPDCCVSTFDSEIESAVVLASGYYTFLTDGVFRPYAGLGLGVADNHFNGIREYWQVEGYRARVGSGDHTSVAYKLSLGALVPLAERIQLNLELSILNTGELSSGGGRWIMGDGPYAIGRYRFDELSYTSATAGISYRF